MDDIKALEDEHARLSAQLRDVSERLLEARVQASGVSIGDIVKTERWGVCRVTHIKPWTIGGRPWLEGNPKKQNGEWSKATRSLFGDWTKL